MSNSYYTSSPLNYYRFTDPSSCFNNCNRTICSGSAAHDCTYFNTVNNVCPTSCLHSTCPDRDHLQSSTDTICHSYHDHHHTHTNVVHHRHHHHIKRVDVNHNIYHCN